MTTYEKGVFIKIQNTIILFESGRFGKLSQHFCFSLLILTLLLLQLTPDQGVQSMDQSSSVKRRCDEEAARVVQQNNVGQYVV